MARRRIPRIARPWGRLAVLADRRSCERLSAYADAATAVPRDLLRKPRSVRAAAEELSTTRGRRLDPTARASAVVETEMAGAPSAGARWPCGVQPAAMAGAQTQRPCLVLLLGHAVAPRPSEVHPVAMAGHRRGDGGPHPLQRQRLPSPHDGDHEHREHGDCDGGLDGSSEEPW